jgi:hypothetical protein
MVQLPQTADQRFTKMARAPCHQNAHRWLGRLCLSGLLLGFFLGRNGFDALRLSRAPLPVSDVCTTFVTSHSDQQLNRKVWSDKGTQEIVLVSKDGLGE